MSDQEVKMYNIEKAFSSILWALGEDQAREGLSDTPRRAAQMLMELTTRKEFKFTTFEAEGPLTSEMIVQSNIPFHSLCEHHMLPFLGTAAVAYIPNGRIVGLSKLTRAVQFCATGLQNQERITLAIAEMLETNLKGQGVAVILKARHLCMEIRGVHAAEVWTTTSAMRGAFTSAATRAEFLELIK